MLLVAMVTTRYFLRQVSNGHVFGFDIQDLTIQSTFEKVKAFNNVTLIQDGHENIKKHIDIQFKGQIDAAILILVIYLRVINLLLQDLKLQLKQ